MLSATDQNTIDLAIDGRHLELVAGSPIFPGMLLIRWPEIPPFGNWVAPHWFLNGPTSVLVALERKHASIDDPFEYEEIMPGAFCLPGDRFLGIVEYTDSLKYGDLLVSVGNGFLHPTPIEAFDAIAIVGVVGGEPVPYTPYASLEKPEMSYARVPVEVR